MNNPCSVKDANYLEIGTGQGSTFISANFLNKINAVGIDNWSQFGGVEIEEKFKENCKKYLDQRSNFAFWDENCFNLNVKRLNRKFNIYFYDGDHSYESQYQAFVYYDEVLADTFIAIVDDYNVERVQKGTQDAFKDLNYAILFEQYLPSRFNGDTTLWWNGMYVAVVKKGKKE